MTAREIIISDFLTQSIVLFAAFLVIYPIRRYLTVTHNRAMTYALMTSLIYGLGSTYIHLTFDVSLIWLLVLFSPFFFYRIYRLVELEFLKLLFVFSFSSTLVAFPAVYTRFLNAYLYPQLILGGHLSINVVLITIGWWILFSILYYFYLHKPYKWILERFNNKKVLNIIWLFPAIFTIILLYVNPTSTQLADPIQFRLTLRIVHFILAAFVFTLFILYQVFKEIIFNETLRNEKAILNLQVANFHKTMDYMDETRRIRHDFRHHMATIYGLVEDQKYQQAQDYVQQYLKSTSGKMYQFTENNALNALLNYYYNKARDNNIKTKFNIHYPETSGISDVDICSIFGNLLENAVEANQHSSNQQSILEVDLLYDHHQLLTASIKNNHQQQIKKQAGRFISTKRNHVSWGLRSVESLVNNYNGTLLINHDETSFEVKILIDGSLTA